MEIKKLLSYKSKAWDVLRSPKTIAVLKLGAAVVGVIHAIDELREAPKTTGKIGFRLGGDD